MKTIQRNFRRHREYNHCRLELLDRYVDRISPALSVHIGIVLSGRGADLGNLSNYDLVKLRHVNKIDLKTRIEDLHGMLRDHFNAAKMLQKSYNASRGRYNFDDPLKQPAYLLLLYKKLRQVHRELSLARSQKRLYKAPVITVEQAKSFLLAEDARKADPFVAYLDGMAAEERKAEMASQLAAAGGAQKRAGETVLLLRNLAAEDCLRALFDVANAFRRMNTKRLRKMSQFHPFGTPSGASAPGATAPGDAAAAEKDKDQRAPAFRANYFSTHSSVGSEGNLGMSQNSDSEEEAGEDEAPQRLFRGARPATATARKASVVMAGYAASGRERSRLTRLQSLASTVDDAERVLKLLTTVAAKRPSAPRPSTAGAMMRGRMTGRIRTVSENSDC